MYRVVSFPNIDKGNGYSNQSANGFDELFEMLKDARNAFNAIDLKKIFVTEWQCRQKPWLSMSNTAYSKELLEVVDGETVDFIDVESYSYWHYKTDEFVEENWQGEGFYKVRSNNPTYIESEEKLKTLIRPFIIMNPTVEFCGSRD